VGGRQWVADTSLFNRGKEKKETPVPGKQTGKKGKRFCAGRKFISRKQTPYFSRKNGGKGPRPCPPPKGEKTQTPKGKRISAYQEEGGGTYCRGRGNSTCRPFMTGKEKCPARSVEKSRGKKCLPYSRARDPTQQRKNTT